MAQPWQIGGERRAARTAGLALLAAAALTVVALPPSALTLVLAFGAWLLLSRDRALGVLPAALVIVLALPYDRAADVGVLRVAGVPIRPQDVVLVAALAISLPHLRRIEWSGGIRLVAVFLAIGVLALGIGILGGNEPRDILRDVRWWGLYAGALLLAGATRPHARVLRAVILGLAVFCALLIVAALLPPFAGGIKERAMAFDQGVLRFQFGPTAFLLIPIAYFGSRLARRGFSRPDVAWFSLFVVGLTLSLTRVTLGVLVVVIILVAGLALWQGRPRWRSRLRAATGAVAVLIVSVIVGFGLNEAGIRVAAMTDPRLASPMPGSTAASAAPSATPSVSLVPTPSAAPASAGPATPVPTPSFPPTGPMARVITDLTRVLAAVSDRFEGYAGALELIRGSPLVGQGLGTLVDVDYTFGAGEFATEGKLPNVDNAYLTVGMKAGIVGIVAFTLLILTPLRRLFGGANRRLLAFWLPAWLGLLALTLTQSFAVIGHSPFVIGLLIAALEGSPGRRAIRTAGGRTGDESRGSQAGEIAPS
jgi:hypothetical protein